MSKIGFKHLPGAHLEFRENISAVLSTIYDAGVIAYRYVPELAMTAGIAYAATTFGGKRYSWLNMNSVSATRFATFAAVVHLVYYIANRLIHDVLGSDKKKLRNSPGDLILIGGAINTLRWKLFSELPIGKALAVSILANQVSQGVDTFYKILSMDKTVDKHDTFLSYGQRLGANVVRPLAQKIRQSLTGPIKSEDVK